MAVSMASSFNGYSRLPARAKAYPDPPAGSTRSKKRRTSLRSRVVGIEGRLFRKTRPYPFCSTRGSQSTTTPRSSGSRMRRPKPCLSASTA